MATILHLETSTSVCSVGISVNGVLNSIQEELNQPFSHAEKITVFIQQVLNDANINLNEVDAVAVTSGPGSYTGLRIGVSTAKGICYALQKPLIAVDSLISLANQASILYPEMNICAAIDARRMEIYSAIFNNELEVIKPISADIIDENSYHSYDPLIVCGDGADKLQSIWSKRPIHFNLKLYASVKGQVKFAFEKYLNKEFEDSAYFEPFYLKDFFGKKLVDRK